MQVGYGFFYQSSITVFTGIEVSDCFSLAKYIRYSVKFSYFSRIARLPRKGFALRIRTDLKSFHNLEWFFTASKTTAFIGLPNVVYQVR